jgi:hypothetical protein
MPLRPSTDFDQRWAKVMRIRDENHTWKRPYSRDEAVRLAWVTSDLTAEQVDRMIALAHRIQQDADPGASRSFEESLRMAEYLTRATMAFGLRASTTPARSAASTPSYRVRVPDWCTSASLRLITLVEILEVGPLGPPLAHAVLRAVHDHPVLNSLTRRAMLSMDDLIPPPHGMPGFDHGVLDVMAAELVKLSLGARPGLVRGSWPANRRRAPRRLPARVAAVAMRGERRRMLALITLVLLVRQQLEGRLTKYDVFLELDCQRALLVSDELARWVWDWILNGSTP